MVLLTEHALPLLRKIPEYIDALKDSLGIGDAAWAWMLYLLVALALACGLSAIAAYTACFEKRIAGWMQSGSGLQKKRTWWVFQPIADAGKLLLTEDIVNYSADKVVFKIAPYVVFIAPFLLLTALPFGPDLFFSNYSSGVLFVLAFSGLSVLGVLIGAYASNSKFSLIGGIRAAKQFISYQIPFLAAILTLVIVVGAYFPGHGLNISKIVEFQQDGLWLVAVQPVSFVLFLVCMLSVTNMAPFDSSTANSEIAGGFQSEYTGMRYAIISLGKYAMLIVMALFGSVLFLGGWHGPPSIKHLIESGSSLSSIPSLVVSIGFWLLVIGVLVYLAFRGVKGMKTNSRFILLLVAALSGISLIVLHLAGSYFEMPILQLGSVWLIIKVLFLVFISILLKWTLPRMRIDQIAALGWKFLFPIAIINLFLTALVVVLVKG